MKLTKLDKRHAGNHSFQYCIDYTRKDCQEYREHRDWCWVNWGASTELEFYNKTNPKNEHWCWLVDSYRMRIYLSSDKDASHFSLRWS